jgi:hypothetical protein
MEIQESRQKYIEYDMHIHHHNYPRGSFAAHLTIDTEISRQFFGLLKFLGAPSGISQYVAGLNPVQELSTLV